MTEKRSHSSGHDALSETLEELKTKTQSENLQKPIVEIDERLEQSSQGRNERLKELGIRLNPHPETHTYIGSIAAHLYARRSVIETRTLQGDILTQHIGFERIAEPLAQHMVTEVRNSTMRIFGHKPARRVGDKPFEYKKDGKFSG